MHVAARKDPARVDLPQYGERALFEAVVNAVAHRDYSIGGSRIRISMFQDRLEIQSPGSLPNNLTVESMATRQATRNEALTSVLARMPVRGVRGSAHRQYFMERRGDGVPIIRRDTQELCGKLPDFQLIDNSELRLTILLLPRSTLRPASSSPCEQPARPCPAPTSLPFSRTRPGSVRRRTKTARRQLICTRLTSL